MTYSQFISNPYRKNPLYNEAMQTIKVNKLKYVSDPNKVIKSQVTGIFLLRHHIGINNAIHRVRVFNLCKKICC